MSTVIMENLVMMPRKLGFYKLHPDVQEPTFATDGSACFDLRAFFNCTAYVKGYNSNNESIQVKVEDEIDGPSFTWITPGSRLMIPTGLIFDIPEGYHIAAHIRGGTGLKRGLVLANGTGIIDEDYVDPTFILLQNTSNQTIKIEHGERLAQARLVRTEPTELQRLVAPPLPKTQRAGGFSSTGTH